MIFEDASQKRWKFTLLVFAVLVVIGSALLATLVVSIAVSPPLPGLQQERENKQKAISVSKELQQIKTTVTTPVKKPFRDMSRLASSSSTTDIRSTIRTGNEFLSLAFLEQSDPESLESFKRHSASVDIAVPDWYYVSGYSCGFSDKEVPDVTAVVTSSHVALMPRVTNGDSNSWHTEEIKKLLSDEKMRNCLARELADSAKVNNVLGLNVDFETLDIEDRDNYLEFLIELANQLHAQKQLLTVDIPVRDPAYDIGYLAKITDAIVVMSYDEHYPKSQPGPIASQDWFVDSLDEILSEAPPEKTIVALGSYAYDWQATSTEPARSLKFSEAMYLAHDVSAEPEMDVQSRNMTFAYQDENGKDHQIWLLNSVSAWNEYLVLKQKKTLGLGLWRLGTEDPMVWEIFNKNISAVKLNDSPPLHSIEYLSEGEVFRIHTEPEAGKMETTLDDDGSIDSAIYHQVPTGYVLEQVGEPIAPKNLILTFDDGPSNEWTPGVLDALSELKIPAAFFLVGDQAQKYPKYLKQMAAAGYMVGNHTYLHSNIEDISSGRLSLELNSTQRVIESAYGRRTKLFRPPYDTDSTPSTPEQLKPLSTADNLGYIIVGANIDSEDWKREGVDNVVKAVEQGVENPDNHVIVMHDAGGERSETIAAVKKFVPELERRGYRFVSLDKAIGVNQDDLNPPLGRGEWIFSETTWLWSEFRSWGWACIVWLFFLTTGISILRILSLGTLVVISVLKNRKNNLIAKDDGSLISVLVPAYNEDKTIEKTIRALQKSYHRNFEAIIIDDGSSDGTAEIVAKLEAEDPRIKLLKKPNGGKASALNLGFQHAAAEIVVTIDADTIVLPETIGELLKPFDNPKVDAVCGNVEVGNAHNILTSFQALEYITTQNFDRRAFDELNCISVVPGATGAWRRNRVIELGGYSNDTLTEDADITLKLLRSGGKIVYASKAKSKTEAPETNAALAKQRFRWSFGTFQCLMKHRSAFFHGTLGWVALPNMFMFQVIFPALSPIGDLVFLLSLIRGDMGAILSGYLMFLMMDLCGSLLAFTLEKKPKKLMWLILIQRFYYRQFMYVITFRSLLAILHGRKHGWNKLKRTGNVLSVDQETVE